jgi:nucleotide-binding universal stress UspA family protein
MAKAAVGSRIALKNILYLTDFSEPSEAALPFAISVAREYEAKLYPFHVFIPAVYTYTTPELTQISFEAQEDAIRGNLQRVDAQCSGLTHESVIAQGTGIWPPIERAIKDYAIDLIVLGTHGRTGAQKLLLGSVAEEVFRRSHVPVLTIGPAERSSAHKAAKFRRVLFATDFTPESQAAAPYALSMAQENNAELLLLHVMKEEETRRRAESVDTAKSNALYRLQEIVPATAELWCRPETLVRTGQPAAEQILNVANDRDADLIVLGIRDKGGFIGAATHLERSTAHKVVVHATCPVLTVRR